MSDGSHAQLSVTGVVQGVGFRPFVYRTAVESGLTGWVKNVGDAGVSIVVEGEGDSIAAFADTLRTDPPPLAEVESITVERGEREGFTDFEIRDSDDADGGSGTVPPDTGVCEACLTDMRDPDSRFHRYWGTSCVDCGPRYTAIRGLPYDRPRTSMDAFPMCEDCRAEYGEPSDRRYHAQTIACPACGPRLAFQREQEVVATEDDAVARTVDALSAGEIIAVKGIGGSHLVCDATDTQAVHRLRGQTGRPAKPFALMSPSLERTREFAQVSDREQSALDQIRRPIVLLDGREGAEWLDGVAPGLHTVGVMLPYSGVHHLLFDGIDTPLVMTSANTPGRPMATTSEGIWGQVGHAIDGALVHDRDIVARTDDSVVRVVDGSRRFVRRSRGWVPQTLPRYPGDAPAEEPPAVLAVGAEFDATVALTQGEDVVPSQHLGNVDSPGTQAFHRETIDHLEELLGVDPEVVACDRHPSFVTTAEANRRAEEGLVGPIAIQHHHAHAASLLGEHDRSRAVVVVADGTGYGTDGTVWGGEVLDATPAEFERVGGLAPFALPGGEAAIERPARILASLLEDPDRIDELLIEGGAVDSANEAAVVREQAAEGLNTPPTTSAGRYLDAVSALLGVGRERRYEGEPAMRLEALARGGTPLDVSVPTDTVDGRPVLDVSAVLKRLEAEREDHPAADLAATAQDVLARGLGRIAVDAAREAGVETVGFSGGVALNEAISETLSAVVREAGLNYVDHETVPPGDAGIAYGQAVAATARLRADGQE